MEKRYLYEVTGRSTHVRDKSWDCKHRDFKLRVVGRDLSDVLKKTEKSEQSMPIAESRYHNDVDVYDIHTVQVKHATLISEVDVW